MKKHETNVIRKWGVFVILSGLIFSSFSAIVAAETSNSISMTFNFDQPTIEEITIGEQTYHRIFLSDVLNDGLPGEPKLPKKGVHMLLPYKTAVKQVVVTPSDRILLDKKCIVEPVGTPYPLYKPTHNEELSINKEIYSKDTNFPKQLYEIVDTYDFRGYSILVLNLNPLQYIPKTGEIYYYTEITITVELTDTNDHPLYRSTSSDYKEVQKKVINPQLLTTYPIKNPDPTGNSDLIIITTSALQSAFEPLCQAHEARGITTKIITLSDIKVVPSTVTAPDIRGEITQAYLEDGSNYVLIGGDADVIPAQKLFVRAWSGGDATLMPSDLYYGCLDGSFNSDEDDKWGEPTDGEDGSDVDLMAEVYVGRACVGNLNEAENFVTKTLNYLQSDPSPLEKNALMVGELLWTNPDTFGGDYMDELVDGHFMTEGIPSDEYTIERLYDRDFTEEWTKPEIISHLNDGYHLVNHLGHSSYGYNMRMVNNDIGSLSNEHPCFIYSQGCMAGGFDDPEGYDSIAEYFTVKTENGAFSGVWNARYGWGVVGGTDGASQRYHRQFIDALFGEQIPESGKANQDSKEDNLVRINGGCMRWCYYQTNLFGDPTLLLVPDIENAQPEKPQRPTGKLVGSAGQKYVFETIGTDPDDDKLYYKWSWGDDTFSDWLGPYESGLNVTEIHNWTVPGFYEIKVRTKDSHGAQSEWSEPYPIFISKDIHTKFPLLQQLLNRLIQLFPLLHHLI